MSEVNPLTQAHNALVDLAKGWPPLTDLVKVRNIIGFTGDDRDPVKEQVQAADLPELRLIPNGFTPHVQRTSSSSTLLQQYTWAMDSGDKRVDDILYPVEWELYRAMATWQETLGAMTWRDKTFVVQSRPQNVQQGINEAAVARNIAGWSSIWSCEVLMKFATSDLQQANPPGGNG